MPDREKMLKQLAGIGIALDMDGNHADAQCVRDALALLKEQEPVEPVPEHPVVINTLACGACHAQVARWDMFHRMSRDAKRVYLFRAKFCPECGRKVKWE